MKRLVLAAALLLASCETDGTSDRNLIQQIQDKAVEVCNFRPTEPSIKAMLLASDPTVVGIQIAYAICDVILTKPFGLIYTPEACPKVNGVCVDGEFVQPKEEESK